MKKVSHLSFSLRMDADEPMELVKSKIEEAFNCSLKEGRYHNMDILKCELLGLTLLFTIWRGINGKHTYQLHGLTDRSEYNIEEVELIKIDRPIIDLLKKSGAGEWRIPSQTEILAESNYESEDI